MALPLSWSVSCQSLSRWALAKSSRLPLKHFNVYALLTLRQVLRRSFLLASWSGKLQWRHCQTSLLESTTLRSPGVTTEGLRPSGKKKKWKKEKESQKIAMVTALHQSENQSRELHVWRNKPIARVGSASILMSCSLARTNRYSPSRSLMSNTVTLRRGLARLLG